MSAAARRARVLLAAITLLPALARAQDQPAEVSAEQVASYQTGLEAGCRRAGRARLETPEKAEAYCACVMKILRENATRAEWQQAYFAFSRQQTREELQALSAHTLKFQACK